MSKVLKQERISCRHDVKLTEQELEEVVKETTRGRGRVVVATILIAGPAFLRTCPGRNGQPCAGNGVQSLELRNMGKPGDPQFTVRNQPCCAACRGRKK